MTSIESTFGIGRLIAKHLTDALDAGEQNQLDAWLKEDEKHTAIFNRIVAHESLAAALVEMQQVNTELALANVKSRISTLAERKPVRLWPRVAVAAAAVAAIVVGVYFFNANRHSNTPPRTEFGAGSQDIAPGKNGATITLANGKVIQLSDRKTGVVIGNDKLAYNDGTDLAGRHPEFISGSRTREATILTASTAKGQTYQFTLPDGTKVWLNADSKISFPSQFSGKERKILLEGEGYFEVVHNAKQPFRVESKGQIVEDIGTEFNINAYADEGSTKTTLIEGSASVNSVILKPNQQSVLAGSNRINVKDIDPEAAIAWKNNKFMFDSQNITDIMRMISRWYNVEVIYTGELPVDKFWGSVSRFDNVSKVLKALESTNNVHFKIEGRRIYVSR